MKQAAIIAISAAFEMALIGAVLMESAAVPAICGVFLAGLIAAVCLDMARAYPGRMVDMTRERERD